MQGQVHVEGASYGVRPCGIKTSKNYLGAALFHQAFLTLCHIASPATGTLRAGSDRAAPSRIRQRSEVD